MNLVKMQKKKIIFLSKIIQYFNTGISLAILYENITSIYRFYLEEVSFYVTLFLFSHSNTHTLILRKYSRTYCPFHTSFVIEGSTPNSKDSFFLIRSKSLLFLAVRRIDVCFRKILIILLSMYEFFACLVLIMRRQLCP